MKKGPVLGVDPGSVATGYGVIRQLDDGQTVVLGAGVIRTSTQRSFPDRLKHLYDSLCQIIRDYHPSMAAFEQVFVAKNAGSALKLGHARAALLMAAINNNLEIFEYSALEIKRAVVGYGMADKRQVQDMVTLILKLDRRPPRDAADALAVALCHIQSAEMDRLIRLEMSRQ